MFTKQTFFKDGNENWLLTVWPASQKVTVALAVDASLIAERACSLAADAASNAR
jgi:hypothetical protein